jgi:hypothetical protein
MNIKTNGVSKIAKNAFRKCVPFTGMQLFTIVLETKEQADLITHICKYNAKHAYEAP